MRVTLFDTLARSLFGHFNVCKFSLCSKPLFIVVVPSFFLLQTINKKRTQLPQLAYRDFGGRKNIRLKTNRTASTRWDCVRKCNKTRHGQYLNKHNQPAWRNVLHGHAGLYKHSRLNSLPRSRRVNPCYGGTVHSGLKPITGMLLSRWSWRLYHGTAPRNTILFHPNAITNTSMYILRPHSRREQKGF